MLILSTQVLTAQPEMILVEGGCFVMGCSPEWGNDCTEGDWNDGYPAHAVQVSSFYIGKYEVTQGQWQAVMGDNPSYFIWCGLNCPVTDIDWYSSIIFCNEMTVDIMSGSDRVYYRDAAMTQPWTITHYNGNGETGEAAVYMNIAKTGYRLPTEAEWEYAARGGKQSQGYKYAGSNVIDDVAWYWSDYGYSTHPVGTKAPNELGIYDMSGNAREYVWDWLQQNISTQRTCDPTGPDSGSGHLTRGGCSSCTRQLCIVSFRFGFDSPDWSLGFRLANRL